MVWFAFVQYSLGSGRVYDLIMVEFEHVWFGLRWFSMIWFRLGFSQSCLVLNSTQAEQKETAALFSLLSKSVLLLGVTYVGCLPFGCFGSFLSGWFVFWGVWFFGSE